MKINHRIALKSDDHLWSVFESAGVSIDRGSCGIWVANLTEDDPAWPQIEPLLKDTPHFITNIFTRHELDAAEWLEMHALGHHGYPQPEDDFGYFDASYDLSNFCRICGIGAVQNAPLRLRAEPKAPHSQFLQLNWVFDEFFIRNEAPGEMGPGLECGNVADFPLSRPDPGKVCWCS